jgi:hypothetical protein
MDVSIWNLILIIITSGVVILLWTRRGRKSNKKPEKVVAKEIGEQLHACIITAFSMNENETGKRLNVPFTSEYIIEYVKEYFSSKGYDGEGCRIEYLREICEGVLPGKLYKIVSKYKNIDDRFGGDWGEFEMTKKTGKEYAQGDVLVGNGPRMLEIFLTGELDELEQDNGTPDDPSA